MLQDLESLDDLDVGEHVAVYGRMHTTLTDALARTADIRARAGSLTCAVRGWMPSWCAADWPVPASRPPS